MVVATGASPILVATGNAGKVREIAELMPGVALVGLGQAEGLVGRSLSMPEETGKTYEENARLKADQICRQSGLVTVADDSGIEVAALGGRPGLHSSRYADSDAGRIERMLAELAALGAEADRSARFVCAAALARPGAETLVFHGQCPGRIVYQPAGCGGFGFDPIFFVEGQGCTMAEVAAEVKNRISHRARAFQALYARLSALGMV